MSLHILSGMKGLLTSRNGTLAILVLLIATFLCFERRIDGMPFAMVVGSVVAIYTFTRAKGGPMQMSAQVAQVNPTPQGGFQISEIAQKLGIKHE